jgi:hypothetical protein
MNGFHNGCDLCGDIASGCHSRLSGIIPDRVKRDAGQAGMTKIGKHNGTIGDGDDLHRQ